MSSAPSGGPEPEAAAGADAVHAAPAAPLAVCLAGHVDHGKSSLLGRLLHELDLLPAGKVAALAAASDRRGVPLEWSFVLDALQLERDQAITLDTTRVRVRTPRRDLLVIDAPGHRELLRNLVTGAADTQSALLVVDAASGAQAQTRRHLALLRLLGVRDVVVAVNKMDLVDWREDRFRAVRDALADALARLGLAAHAIVPASARAGANLVRPPSEAPWWSGPTLVAALESLPERAAAGAALPLRVYVQDVYRIDGRRIVAGRLDSGTLAAGDRVLLLPGTREARVAALAGWPLAPQLAVAGDNAAIVFDEEIVVERGELACAPDDPPKLTPVFDADLFWLGHGALAPGRRLVLRIGTREVGAQLAAVHHVLDDASLERIDAPVVGEGGVARVTLRCDALLAVDDAARLPATGRFVLADDGAIVGGGVIDASGYPDQRRLRARPRADLTAVRHHVQPEERTARAGHAGAVVWLTGLSGAGKSTLAMALERRLFDLGWSVYTLDGDNVRGGLNADLGFSPEDRQENIRRVGEVAALFADAGVVCITAFISPYRDDRARARAAAGPRRFLEVHVDSDVATCEARDPKGLYRRARAGTLKGMTGVDSPYEPPEAADLTIDTRREDVAASVERLCAFVLAQCRG
ncbi:MAG: adenylyl-sulfate kinase [Betaproteobacteria bacterium]|nr:MAG: adenylyl-sulfate kinase [Betaproteobacteria bacterium]